MTEKTQEEMLAPVNGYQLEAVITELGNLKTDNNKRFDKVDIKLDTLINKGFATCSYVDAKVKESEELIMRTMDLKYGSTKHSFDKIKWIIVASVLNIIIPGVIYLVILNKAGSL